MNTRFVITRTAFATAVLALSSMAFVPTILAQAFDSGSDGSYGPMTIASNSTLALPANGKFNCTTITISNGATLKFTRNNLNTPVYLLATGDVNINGLIDLNGRDGGQGLAGEGGPGGFDGGTPAQSSSDLPGDGMGPGSGRGGRVQANQVDGVKGGSFGTVGTYSSTNLYGNALIFPLLGGSGGGGSEGNPGIGGGGGGGAILIASNTKIQFAATGTILAQGGTTPYNQSGTGYGAGSGGGVRLVSPVVTGSGSVNATSRGWGGQGRIRIDALDKTGWSFNFNGKFSSGKNMVVFPSPLVRLDIIEAAGQIIPEGTNNAVSIQLPTGSPTNQLVKVQARDFTNSVPIRVVVTPDNAPSTSYDTNIVMSSNPATVAVPVIIPPGSISRISAWAR